MRRDGGVQGAHQPTHQGIDVSISELSCIRRAYVAVQIEIADSNVVFYSTREQSTVYNIVNRTAKHLDFMLNHLRLEDWDFVADALPEDEQVCMLP